MKKIAFACVATILIFCSLIFWISFSRAAAYREFLGRVRPDGVTNITSFLGRFPRREGAWQSATGQSHHVVIAIPAPDVSGHIPSGPPIYVFDPAGRLVDWSSDMGDDPEFWRKWQLQSARRLTDTEFELYLETYGRGNGGTSTPIR